MDFDKIVRNNTDLKVSLHYEHFSDELIKAIFFISKGHPLFDFIIVEGVS